MIDLSTLFIVFLIVLVSYFIWKGMVERENTLMAIRQHCRQQGLQLLDENIALHRLWFKRDASGQLRSWRSYRFEFSSMGDERYQGKVDVLAGRVIDIQLEPFRLPSEG